MGLHVFALVMSSTLLPPRPGPPGFHLYWGDTVVYELGHCG